MKSLSWGLLFSSLFSSQYMQKCIENRSGQSGDSLCLLLSASAGAAGRTAGTWNYLQVCSLTCPLTGCPLRPQLGLNTCIWAAACLPWSMVTGYQGECPKRRPGGSPLWHVAFCELSSGVIAATLLPECTASRHVTRFHCLVREVSKTLRTCVKMTTMMPYYFVLFTILLCFLMMTVVVKPSI